MMKSDMLEIALEYGLFDSERDLINVSYAMNEDEFADFIGFLFTGDWSRNVTVLPTEWQRDPNVKELFEYIECHCC